MRISHQIVLNLFEAAEAIGIPREALARPLGRDPASLADPRVGGDWDALVALMAELSELVAGDVERLREVGTKMVAVPSFAGLQRLGRALFSAQSIYVAGERWFAAANVPHLVIRTTFPDADRMHFTLSIPEPYAASRPFLHIFEGLLRGIPTMIGLPPARLESSRVTDRELDAHLSLPRSRSLLAQLRGAARAVVHYQEMLDIVEAQRLEVARGLDAARRSTAEIVTVFDRLPDLVVLHRAGKIVWLNRSASRTFGFDAPSEAVGRNLAAFFHASSQALAEERIYGDVDSADVPDLVEANLVSRDGSRVVVEVSPTQIVTFEEKEARLFVARDVTDRNRLQRQLAIADRLASVGMLAAGVAHEVNNPLAYVLNNIEIARREIAPLGAAARQGQAALEVALEGVSRIRTTVRDLLALARVEHDHVGPVDPRKVVESTLALTKPQIVERAALVCEILPTPPVIGTPSRLGQVLLNVIANALDAMSPTNRDDNVLRLAVRSAAPAHVVIEVSDTGSGIAPEHAAHVFDPFFTTKAAGKGTGLGLAISQRLLSEIGGEISFESADRVGTTFRIMLPTATDGELHHGA